MRVGAAEQWPGLGLPTKRLAVQILPRVEIVLRLLLHLCP